MLMSKRAKTYIENIVQEMAAAVYKALEDIFTKKNEFLHSKLDAGMPPDAEQLTRFMATIAGECKAAMSAAPPVASASPVLGNLVLPEWQVASASPVLDSPVLPA